MPNDHRPKCSWNHRFPCLLQRLHYNSESNDFLLRFGFAAVAEDCKCSLFPHSFQCSVAPSCTKLKYSRIVLKTMRRGALQNPNIFWLQKSIRAYLATTMAFLSFTAAKIGSNRRIELKRPNLILFGLVPIGILSVWCKVVRKNAGQS